MQWRVRRAPPYRRVFSSASVGLSYGAASVTFHGLSRLFPAGSGRTLIHATVWTLLVMVTVLVKSVLNKAMIMTAVKATDPARDYPDGSLRPRAALQRHGRDLHRRPGDLRRGR